MFIYKISYISWNLLQNICCRYFLCRVLLYDLPMPPAANQINDCCEINMFSTAISHWRPSPQWAVGIQVSQSAIIHPSIQESNDDCSHQEASFNSLLSIELTKIKLKLRLKCHQINWLAIVKQMPFSSEIVVASHRTHGHTYMEKEWTNELLVPGQ